MPSMPWIKLYTKILDDVGFGTLPTRLQWRLVQLMMLSAKIAIEANFICTLKNISSWCNCTPDELLNDLKALGKCGMIAEVEHHYTRKDPWEEGILFWRFSPAADNLFDIGYSRDTGGEWEKTREIIFSRDNYICRYCGALAEHIDHVIPVCKGGTNDLDNLVAACASCNLSKGGRTPAEAGMEVR